MLLQKPFDANRRSTRRFKDKNRLYRMTLVVVVGLVCVACSIKIIDNFDKSVLENESNDFSSEGIREIEAATINGSIEVDAIAEPDDPIEVAITKRCKGEDEMDAEDRLDKIRITDSVRNGRLIINADMPQSGRYDYQADITITTPQLSRLELNTVNGSIIVDEYEGSIEADTVNGNIRCDIAELQDADSIELDTVNGNISLTLPSEPSASIEAATTNGRITVDDFGELDLRVDTSNSIFGTLGEGDGTIELQTTNGNISVRKR